MSIRAMMIGGAGASPPDAPTIGTATAGNTSASVAFSAPANNGGSAITGYTVTASPGGATASGASSPLTVTGLSNGTAYTFTVTATNAIGTSPASSASNSVTPAVPSATLTVTLYGGGGASGETSSNGGGGGFAQLTISNFDEQQIRCVVGSGGLSEGGSGWTAFGGPGKRSVSNDQGGAGGGYSGIFKTDGTPLAIVGGGGGSDWQDQGGMGGSVNQNGGGAYDGNTGSASQQGEVGKPGTTSAGGVGGTGFGGCTGGNGSYLQGGNVTCGDTYAGGGGGGGYYGGGGGTGNTGAGGTPGGGGSGFLTSAYTTSTSSASTSFNRDSGTYNAGSRTYPNAGSASSLGVAGGGFGLSGNLSNRSGLPGYVKVVSSVLGTVFDSSTPQSTLVSVR